MKNKTSNIIIILFTLIFASCEDNLHSPSVNPDISANKKILLEVFTSITCANCVQANLFCDNISNFSGITSNDTNVLIINYHPSFFPADPFFQFNRVLNIERQQYYVIHFIPSGFSDGNRLPSSFSASQWINSINNDLAEEKQAAISTDNILDTASRSGSIVIRIEPGGSFQNNNLKLYLILTESDIFHNGPMGSKYYNNIARQMLNSPGGLPIEILPGQTSVFNIDYIIDQGIVIRNSAIILFVQNNDSKVIICAEKINL